MKPIDLELLFEKLNAANEHRQMQLAKLEKAQIKKDTIRPD
jgi:hypothetical protein